MKKLLTNILIGCSLALAGAALAQQPVEQQSPAKGKRAPEKKHATEAKPGPNAAKPQEKPAKQSRAIKERGVKLQRAGNLRPLPRGDRMFPSNRPAHRSPAPSSRLRSAEKE